MWAAGAIDANIAGLQIPVDDAPQMCGVNGLAHADEDLENALGTPPRVGACSVNLCDPFVERQAVDVVHDEIMKADRYPRIVHRDDAWMIELSERFDLALETDTV